jgi:hypothetical protein
MSEHDPEARTRLLKLLKLRLGKDIGYDEFRIEFESAFNFGLDRTTVSEQEFKVFQRVFDTVIWYSPFPDERAMITNYIGEAEMESIVAEARRVLGISTVEGPDNS